MANEPKTPTDRPVYVPQATTNVPMAQGGSGFEKRHLHNHKSWLKKRARNGKTWLQRKVASKTYCPPKSERGGY